jgi:hypothetical protein
VTRKKHQAEPTWPSRPVTEGSAVTLTVNDEERTLKATKDGAGWSITPTDAAEAAALERFADAAFDPPPPPEPEEDEAGASDDSAGNGGDGGDQA